MSEYSKLQLTGSTNGRPVKVVQTATPGTTIHTASATADVFDEVWLWAINTSAAAVKLTLEWGGTTSPDDLIEQTIRPEDGAQLVVPGLILDNSLVAKAFAATGNVITIVGFVNRIDQS